MTQAASVIPYGAYWCTPFAKWQGTLSHLHSLTFAAAVARDALAARALPVAELDFGVLGMTVPQQGCFYGLPWLTGLIGAEQVAGPTVAQACATSARCLQVAAQEVQAGLARCALVVTADRVSNGPHIYYPAPTALGGTGVTEDWVLANFNQDPFARVAMVETAERVAARFGITMQEQHDLVLQRHAQYQAALADDRAFQRRYMVSPLSVPNSGFTKSIATLDGDEGVYPTTAEGLARLKPVQQGGTVTFGAQTHPADGNAGLLVTTPARAAALSARPEIGIQIVGFGTARTEPGLMPYAPIPATARALQNAGLAIGDIDLVKTHNPFAVNDIAFSRETGFPLGRMNDFGCSLIWGHPQGPTGLRAIIELIEALALRGGGTGVFNGCAAGDSAMAVIIRVGDARH